MRCQPVSDAPLLGKRRWGAVFANPPSPLRPAQVNEQRLLSGQPSLPVHLNSTEPTLVNVTCVAQDGVTSRTYSVSASRGSWCLFEK